MDAGRIAAYFHISEEFIKMRLQAIATPLAILIVGYFNYRLVTAASTKCATQAENAASKKIGDTARPWNPYAKTTAPFAS